MRRVRSTETSPERAIRSLLHRMGFRFRLYRKGLPGKPDIVLPKHRTALFVHGCFWHRHTCRSRATTPATNQEYWLPKFERTVARDKQAQAELHALGWKVLVVWECELKDAVRLMRRLVSDIAEGVPTKSLQDVSLPLAAEGHTSYEVIQTQNRNPRLNRK
jgi:DNA mismatch endonuclease, patch repair protein